MRPISLFAALLLSACHHDQAAKGPFERAGAGLDRASEKTQQGVTTAATATGDALDRAGKATGRAFERAGQKLDGSGAPAQPADSTHKNSQ